MIVVTQGHEKGIGLEVFFKALALAPSVWTDKCRLVAHKRTVLAHLKRLNLPAEIDDDYVYLPTGRLSCEWLKNSNKLPASGLAMEAALEAVEENTSDILFTLPTTKDDLRNPKKPSQRFLGHTEYLRARYKTEALGMFFASPHLDVLLLTDHLPLAQVGTTLTAKYLKAKLQASLSHLRQLEPHLKRALVAGVNPHAGEGGLLGREEARLTSTLSAIKVPGFKVLGFYPGDTLLKQKQSSADLLVYPHHDQGLAPFKSLMGTLGANITLGLPFVRLSVDHGTAFPLYGKNIADPRGAFFCLRKAISYQERVSGKDSNHQGQGPQP
jgi:4-hydroxy-L-threonine phosphate dehydrogenase PdxA